MAGKPNPTTPSAEAFRAAWYAFPPDTKPYVRVTTLAAQYGTNDRNVRRWRDRYMPPPTRLEKPPKPAPASPPPEVPRGKPTSEDKFSESEWEATRTTGRRITTQDELIAFLKPDLTTYDLVDWGCRAWEGFIKNSAKEPKLTPTMFSVYAKFKRSAAKQQEACVLSILAEKAAGYAPVYAKITRKASAEGNLCEIAIPDHHFGKLAHAEESGDNYDLALAESLYRVALLDLLAKVKGHSIDRFCFVIGNDLIHVNSNKNLTYNLTPQDVDTRYHKIFRRVLDTMVWAIEQMRLIAPVDVPIVPGNHDTDAAWHLGIALQAWFRRAEDVSIDTRVCPRKYYCYGKNLILFTHGDNEKLAGLAQLAAAEEPQMWGDTTFREAHIGHKHKVALDEAFGFRVRTLPSLCGPDAWHYKSGFTQNIRSAEAYIWHKTQGIVGTAVYNMTAADNEKATA